MKKLIPLLLAALLLVSLLSACGQAESAEAAWACGDGRARPSSCGRLQVKDGKLCDEQGEPVMLRGVSLKALSPERSIWIPPSSGSFRRSGA